ncbi:hypothetical protein Tsubulata_020393 [Turnera subulata]|uniref:Ataxin-10 domain-containing protein n=1 Tax=Turnera subulata TaxID=218843 RepID=A0A9Q0FGY9_9ROSI|nr:hypothetical protein Tsubulata_020393 [Turnera subulata]
MGDTSLMEILQEKDLLEPLFKESKSSDLTETLEILTEVARTDSGRSNLASKQILPVVLRLCKSIPYPKGKDYLALALKLLRNLCAGEVVNQSCFIWSDGVDIVSNVLRSVGFGPNPDFGIVRAGLQVLANVSLAGQEHQQAIWQRLFPDGFLMLAKVRSRETFDPLCMIIYVCCDGNPGMFSELCGDQGLPTVAEIVRTASAVGFGQDWFKLIISRICLEDVYFPQIFSTLYSADGVEGIGESGDSFTAARAYLLRIVSDILNERLEEVEFTVPAEFAVCVFGIFMRSASLNDPFARGDSALPTGSTATDVLGYSLTILRDLCARDGRYGLEEGRADVVDTLLSNGLLQLLLGLLGDLEPPAIISKALKQVENQEASTSSSHKPCPYKGFRRDLVAVIANCVYRRKHAQDEIRERNGILLLLQQCVTDENNPFLREWGIWCVRNLLEGNEENKLAVAELELQGTVDMPELSRIGLRVEVDPKTRRPKLVNT